MGKVKKILVALFLSGLTTFCLAGCNANTDELEKELAANSMGTLFTLQEAYDNGYLTKADLESIAHDLNEDIDFHETLDCKIESTIKETAAYHIRNRDTEPFPEATAEGFLIIAFYGVYSNNYIIKLRNDYDINPTDVPNYWEEIDGIQFNFVGYDEVMVWKGNE